MKKLLFFLFFCNICVVLLRGQGLQPLFTIYREQTVVLNPAMPSTNYLVNELNNTISTTYRYQWLGMEDAPVTQVVNWEWLPTDRNILVGANVVNDKTGKIGLTSANLQFAYKLMMSSMDNRFLSIGFSAGMQQARINIAEDAAEQNVYYPNQRRIVPDLNMGVYYHHDNIFYAGISTPQLLGSVIYSQADNNQRLYSLNKVRHFYAVTGMYIDAPFFGNDGAFLEPTTWIRYIPETKTFSFDVNLRAKISNSFWASAGYNLYSNTLNIETGSILGESIGLDAGHIKIGLGFGVPLGVNKWQGLGGIGEVVVSYSWGN
ncbi:MAG: PorP/SprF family type IX secretion system membrane protein [Saprospiraceae bacterium]|nr:PorP/SprF family type IX secretion system membrane protein [Saprospiraceae bacterium]